MNAIKFPETLQEAVIQFASLDACHDFMVAMRWPNGVTCPRCHSKEVGKLSLPRRVWNCKGCKKQFTVKVGSLFEDSAIPLTKWLPAVWLIVNAKNGISSCELARHLDVTQRTAWFMSHRIRKALHNGSFEKMRGGIEADETFIGAKARNMHKAERALKVKGTGPIAMTPVMGLLERSERAKCSRVKLAVLKTRKKSELQSHVRQYVLKGSTVHTDALPSYNGLSDEYTHNVVDHAVEYVRGNVHTNGLENFWSLLKRTIKGTHVHVAPFDEKISKISVV
jgi:transposase-like protein